MNVKTAQARSVGRIVDSIVTLEGAGFQVRRPFPNHELDHCDPFLLLDHFGPVDYAPGEAVGAPDHPHRGFETVTYVLEGSWEHKDSVGNAGFLGAGDVQWMTAGAGIVHSEMPSADLVRTGGRMHGFQLWVNLPSGDKMMPPRYQDVPSARIPIAHTDDGRVAVKVIAGEALGASAVIDTRTPIMYLHFTLQPGARFVQPVPPDYNVFAYVVEGTGLFGDDDEPAREGQMLMFRGDGEAVALAAADRPLQALLLGGVPLNEPVARYGPFVMNTREEIVQAIRDYQAGLMGRIGA